MQYQVPQFIEIEDKIFGPFTLKQFIYLAGGAGACLLFYTLLPLWLAILFGVPFGALALGLAFYKVNDRPLIVAIEHGIGYYIGSKLYLWKQRTAAPAPAGVAEAPKAVPPLVPKLSESKLKDLAWSLNIKDREKLGVTTQAPTGLEL